MNPEQTKSTIRWLVATFGAGFAGWAAGKGFAMSPEQITAVLNSEAFAGIVVALIPLISGLVAKTRTNLIAAVGNLKTDNGAKLVPQIVVADQKIAEAANIKTAATVVAK